MKFLCTMLMIGWLAGGLWAKSETSAPAAVTLDEARIAALEARIQAAAAIEDLPAVAQLKAELGPLYVQRDLLNRDPRRNLDQGGDVCADAVTIFSIPFCDFGTTLGYNGDYIGDCANSAAPDVVYRYVTTQDERLTFSLCGSSYDALLHIWQGCPANGGVQVACVDDFCGLSPCITLMLEADWEYFIIVDGYLANAGSYRFNVVPETMGCVATTCGFQNDDCEEALAVNTPTTISGSTIGATLDMPPASSNCGVPNGPGVWYKFAGQDSTLELVLSSASSPHQVFLYCGCCTELWCMWETDCTIPAGIGIPLQSGLTYWLLVAGCDGVQGTFELQLNYIEPYPNGGCGVPIRHDLAAPGVVTGTTCGLCNYCGLRPSEDALVRVNIPYRADWVFSLCGSGFDSYLYLGTQPCTGDLYARDDTCGLNPTTPCLTLDAGDYFLTIEAWASNVCGNYTLRVNPCPLEAPRHLVIQPNWPDIRLYWDSPINAVAANYRVFRSTDPDNVVTPGNLLGTTTNTYYVDLQILMFPDVQYFYAVTANAP